jgi:hypothetical protein
MKRLVAGMIFAAQLVETGISKARCIPFLGEYLRGQVSEDVLDRRSELIVSKDM